MMAFRIYNKEHFQRLLKEAEEEKEELLDEISSLRALLDALQMDAPQLIESENEVKRFVYAQAGFSLNVICSTGKK